MLYYLKRLYSTPFRIVLIKLFNKIIVFLNNLINRRIDFINRNTHININVPIIKTSYIDIKNLDVSNIDLDVAKYLSKMYIDHKFDLLGSGWVKNSYDSAALGLEGYKYYMNVAAPASAPEGYEPIDWQKDFKSGFRWNEKKWYKDQRIADKLGSDIKVPWELTRLQHLPQLAIFAIMDSDLKEQNLIEFKNQILDFIKHNPPRMGVNWTCTMDVGIRVANMLVAYDMFSQMDGDKNLDENFKQIFSNSIYEHALHIVNNLEYSPYLTSNHYLSDIAGLLYACSYLDGSEEIDAWLVFAIQERIGEMKKAFYEDGGNFESYHRLSAELMIYSVALINGLGKKRCSILREYNYKIWKKTPKLLPLQKQEFGIENDRIIFPQWFIDRLYKIGRFTIDITKPNGKVPQFGDNDSGRFFRFSPNGEFLTNKQATQKYLNLEKFPSDDELFWDEDIINHATLIGVFEGIFDDDIFKSDFKFEKSFIKTMAKFELKIGDKDYKTIEIIDKDVDFDGLKFSQINEFHISNLKNF